VENEIAGKNNQAIANDMTIMAQTLAHANTSIQGQHNQHRGADELQLDRFMRNNPPAFKERYDPKGAQWRVLMSRGSS